VAGSRLGRRRRRHGRRHLRDARSGDHARASRGGAVAARAELRRYELLTLLSFTQRGTLPMAQAGTCSRCTRPASPTP
jgi:hypothetical protein